MPDTQKQIFELVQSRYDPKTAKLPPVSRGLLSQAYEYVLKNPRMCLDPGFLSILKRERGVLPKLGALGIAD